MKTNNAAAPAIFRNRSLPWLLMAAGALVWFVADRNDGQHGILMSPADAQETPKSLKPAAVDGGRALGYLRKICDIVPMMPT